MHIHLNAAHLKPCRRQAPSAARHTTPGLYSRATGFLRLGQLRGYRGATPACMGPKETSLSRWHVDSRGLVMHTLWLHQSAALKGSHRCLVLPCFYEEHDVPLRNTACNSDTMP
jgi:hypothetical protein